MIPGFLPGLIPVKLWTPASIANLLAAWEPNNPNIVLTSGRVSSVPGSYGTQATIAEFGTSGPTFSATGWNGKPCFVFSGAQFLYTDTIVGQALAGTNIPCTIVWASQVSSTPGNYCAWGLDVKENDRSMYHISLNNTSYEYVARQASSVVDHGIYSISPVGQVVWACRFTDNTHYDVFRNGIKETATSNTNSLAPTALAFNRFIMGCVYQGALVSPYVGNIGPLWIYSRDLTDAEILVASIQMQKRNLE